MTHHRFHYRITMPRRMTAIGRPILALLLVAVMTLAGRGDELTKASWDWPNTEVMRTALDEWLVDRELSPEARQQIEKIWNAYQPQVAPATNAAHLLEAIVDTVSVALPAAAPLIERARQTQLSAAAEVEQLPWTDLPPVVADNLRLLFGRSLALGQLYDDAQTLLSPADIKHVADPAALLFYRAVTHHRLREKKAGLADLRRVREREGELPDRYASLTQLMQVDLQQLKDDSLDEVARIMDSVKIRLGHGHAGTRVRKEEQDVVDKLDKMIDELEKQLSQMQMAQAGAAGGLKSNSPAQDSMLPGGAQGQGDVDAKKLSDNVDWGNMPPKEREEAIQQLGKEFPSHYRDIIEEYFRKLAQENQRDE